LKFRNYQPKAEELKDGIIAPVKISVDKELEKMGAVRCMSCPFHVMYAVRVVCSSSFGKLQVQTTAEIQLDVAPKKANWDLKQHIAKKLEKLERRTQQAIVELIKEKVSQEGNADEQGRLLAQGVSNKAS